jgi:hypothetical protein
MLTSYHEHTQWYFSNVQPVVNGPEKRHDWPTESEIANPRVHRYTLEGEGEEVEERVGVYHLVHSWIQQNQPKKVCDLWYMYTT